VVKRVLLLLNATFAIAILDGEKVYILATGSELWDQTSFSSPTNPVILQEIPAA
jgi:hypothetical protein